MNTPSIVFDGVWKKFRRGEVHDSLRDLVPALVRRVTGRGDSQGNLTRREFWALQDVSFSVGPGDALGIIGANGAGKSTVLKTLTRILRPTRGSVSATGRVGALIEVAAGFHQDLTGRENVFLQGAIMGMPKELIRRRFDEIVDFSGVSEFLDTPVKRYSSGMNARLGFSIAAHLDPDILVVDEVLSVGDLFFQQRAFDRLKALVRSGIPVVVVSHQLERIAELCTRCIQLDLGRVVFDGGPAECIASYFTGVTRQKDETAPSELPVVVRSTDVVGSPKLQSGDEVQLRLVGEILVAPAEIGIRVRSAEHGGQIFATSTVLCGLELPKQGPFQLLITFDMNVAPGVYSFEPYVRVFDAGQEAFVGIGPTTHVQVLPDPRSQGIVQLNPRFAVDGVLAEPGCSPGEGAGPVVRGVSSQAI